MSNGWLDLGGIISDYQFYDFNKIKVRPFTVSDLSAIDTAVKHKSVETMVTLMQDHVDVDVTKLLDMDFRYVLHWLKQKSFPESSITITWRCVNYPIHIKDFPKRYDKRPEIQSLNTMELHRLGLEKTKCSRLNTEIVYTVRNEVITIPPGFKLPKGYKFPTVQDLLDAEEMEESPELQMMIPYLMWIKADSLYQAVEEFDWLDFSDAIITTVDGLRALEFGTYINYELTCQSCGKAYPIRKNFDMFNILPGISQKTVMELQYNIFGNFPGAVISEDTPAMKLLFWHSNLVKDKQKQKEEQAKKEHAKGRSLR